ncbi:LysR family transcriptional regulator [Uliginosibacterium sediminicola]|uniref:LysR family transcriptional regulator n=1 Tax=Uliginosibacterium sediminicola TaxID=2024550 RepID=A0ABU9Z1E1_9RHOO
MKIDFDGIQAFVAIAELGGFGKAAEQLHLTQTALTRRIQKLEDYLGVKLLDRTTRSVALTAVGREFLPRAKGFVVEMSEAIGNLKDLSRSGRGDFCVACVPTMASHALPAVISDYSAAYPGNRIRILDTNAFDVRKAVLSGQAELGVGIPMDAHPEILEISLLEEPYMFFCRQEHPLSAQGSVTWADMREAELIMISSLSVNRVFLDYQLAKQGISLRGAYEVQHLATAIGLVAAGVGTAILPASTLQAGARPGVLSIPLVGPQVQRTIVLILRRNTTLSPPAQAFCELLRARYA